MDIEDKSAPLYLGLVLSHPSEDSLPRMPQTIDDFFKVGVVVRVLQVSVAKPGAPMQLLVQALERFDVVELERIKGVFRAEVQYWLDGKPENTEEIKAYAVAIIDCIKELVNLNPLFKEGLSLLIERINLSDPSALADFSASMTTSSGTEIQEIRRDPRGPGADRGGPGPAEKELEITKLKAQISKRIEDQLSKQQREFFLKQQLQEIKKELGLAKDESESEIDKFQQRLKKLVLSDEAGDRIQEELEKLRLLGPSSAEFNVSRAYLDWLTVLPWGSTPRITTISTRPRQFSTMITMASRMSRTGSSN